MCVSSKGRSDFRRLYVGSTARHKRKGPAQRRWAGPFDFDCESQRLLDNVRGGGGDVLGLGGGVSRRAEGEVLGDRATLLVDEHGHLSFRIQVVLGRAVLVGGNRQGRRQLVGVLELLEIGGGH